MKWIPLKDSDLHAIKRVDCIYFMFDEDELLTWEGKYDFYNIIILDLIEIG